MSSYSNTSLWSLIVQGNCSGNVFLRFSLELKVGIGERFGPLSLTNEQAYTTCCMPRSSLILYAGMRSFHPHDYYTTIKHWHILQFKKAWHNNSQQTLKPTSQFFSSFYSSIQPCTLLPSSPLFLPLLALSQASPSILPFLPSHITHRGLTFPPKCQQMQIFIILVNTFNNSCEQLKRLQKSRMKLHLATEGTIMTCFSLFSAEEKLMCLNLFLSFFHQKRLVN